MRLGYEKKVARRLAKFCYLSMAFTCGLFGLFERQKAPIYLITGAGAMHAGARTGMFSPAISSIRR